MSVTSFNLKAELRKERGLASKIAQLFDIEPSAVWQWKQVPATRVKAVSKLLGIPQYRIRPDVFSRRA